jgi:hypothetical protein
MMYLILRSALVLQLHRAACNVRRVFDKKQKKNRSGIVAGFHGTQHKAISLDFMGGHYVTYVRCLVDTTSRESRREISSLPVTCSQLLQRALLLNKLFFFSLFNNEIARMEELLRSLGRKRSERIAVKVYVLTSKFLDPSGRPQQIQYSIIAARDFYRTKDSTFC